MTNWSAFVLMAVLCATPLIHASSSRQLLGGEGGGASVVVGSSAESSDGGSAASNAFGYSTRGRTTAIAQAAAFASTEVKNEVIEYCIFVLNGLKYWDQENYCTSVLSEIYLEIDALAYSLSEAYASSFAEITIGGDGSACAWSEADAYTAGKAIAEIIVQAIAAAQTSSGTAVAAVQASVIEKVFTNAYASAWSEACGQGKSYAASYQDTYAQACIAVLPEVLVYALAHVECGDNIALAIAQVGVEENVKSSTFAEGRSGSESSGDAFGRSGGEGRANYFRKRPRG